MESCLFFLSRCSGARQPKPRVGQKCYLCVAAAQLTNQHLPSTAPARALTIHAGLRETEKLSWAAITLRPLIDLDFESVSFKARSDREALGFLRCAALRRLDV